MIREQNAAAAAAVGSGNYIKEENARPDEQTNRRTDAVEEVSAKGERRPCNR